MDSQSGTAKGSTAQPNPSKRGGLRQKSAQLILWLILLNQKIL
jgi:hypothetical protein